jgi:hypothetical protein
VFSGSLGDSTTDYLRLHTCSGAHERIRMRPMVFFQQPILLEVYEIGEADRMLSKEIEIDRGSGSLA